MDRIIPNCTQQPEEADQGQRNQVRRGRSGGQWRRGRSGGGQWRRGRSGREAAQQELDGAVARGGAQEAERGTTGRRSRTRGRGRRRSGGARLGRGDGLRVNY